MFAMSLARGLTVEHGWKVTIVTTTPKGLVQREVFSDCVAIRRLPYKLRLSNSPISIAWLGGLRRVIAEEKPDVICVNLPVPGLGDMVSYAAAKRPVIVVYHFGSMKKGSLLLDPLIWLYESFLLPITLRKALHIVCGSDYVREGILGKFKYKTSIIPPGVDCAHFHPADSRVTEPRVLYVGSLNRSDKHKRFSDLLEACRILLEDIPDLRLSVVGGGDGLRMYRNLAAEMGIAESVDFHGRLHGEQLAAAYRDAAVLALPSLREAFGMVVTEAMATGLPIVAVNGGGISTLVDDGKDGLLVPPRNPKALAIALKTILTDPESASAMGQTGRGKVCEQLAWSRVISLINKIFMGAISEPVKDMDP